LTSAAGSLRAQLFGQGRGAVLAFCWLGWVFDFFDLFLFELLNTDIASDLSLNVNTHFAWITGWVMFATAFGGFGLGWVADRWGRRKAMVWSILIYSVGTVATGFANDYWTLLAARVVTAIGVGGEWGIGHALVAETYPPHLRGRAAGILQAGTPAAIALAAALASISGIGWRTCFIVAGIPAVLVFFARRAVPDAKDVRAPQPGSFLELVQPPFRNRSLLLWALVAVHLAAFWSSYSWLPRMLRGEPYLFTRQQVGLYQITVAMAQLIGNVSFGFVADRFGRQRAFVGYCAVFTAGLVTIALASHTIMSSGVLITAAMSFTALGLGTWSAFGPLFAVNYPERLRAMASSGIYNLGRTQQLIVQPVVGRIREGGWDAGALLFAASMAVLSAVLMFAVPQGEKPRGDDGDAR
jgi:MFS family permease